MKKLTKNEFLTKCAWEGGCLQSGFEHGLDETNLCDSVDRDFYDKIKKLSDIYKKYKRDAYEIYKGVHEIENLEEYVENLEVE